MIQEKGFTSQQVKHEAQHTLSVPQLPIFNFNSICIKNQSSRHTSITYSIILTFQCPSIVLSKFCLNCNSRMALFDALFSEIFYKHVDRDIKLLNYHFCFVLSLSPQTQIWMCVSWNWYYSWYFWYKYTYKICKHGSMSHLIVSIQSFVLLCVFTRIYWWVFKW